MNPSNRLRVVRAVMLGLMLLAPIFLMGDFCQDVLTIPIVVDYSGDEIDITVNFIKRPVPDYVPEDADVEPPEDDFELNPDGYRLQVRHQTIDFTDSAKGVSGLANYKGNLDGVFIRSVTYRYDNNTIPGDLPPLDIYVSPLIQQEGSDGSDETTLDWAALIESGDLERLSLPDDGIGEHDLIKLGETERRLHEVPVENFPTGELRLIRETANLDYISDAIMSNFAFEMVVIPRGRVVIEERNKDQLPEDRVGRISLSLRFVVVVAAKP